MAHRQHGFFGALFGGRAQDRIEQRDQRRLALERVALRAQIARLQHLLENVRAYQQVENSRAIGLRGFRFHPLLHPLASLAIGDVHEFHADASAVDSASRVCLRPRNIKLGHRCRLQIAERVEICLQVSPAAKRFPDAFLRVLRCCRFRDCLFPAHTVRVPWSLSCVIIIVPILG